MENLAGRDVGKYHIIEQLGAGGMAVVYKALDTDLERMVALKFIRKELISEHFYEQVMGRFKREAKVLAALEHPNIVTVHDYGQYNGSPYIVMRFIPCGALQPTGRPLDFAQAARLLAPVARALEYAHKRGVIHRDLKPSNILLCEDGTPTLSDFGIARILDEAGASTQLTGTGLAIGTPEYMAPEQWQGKPIAQSDIYGLGMVFYELLTGTRPFTAETPAAVMLKQFTEPLPRPRDLVPGIPEAVENVIFKALALKPEHRYASMMEFAAALEELARVAPAPAARPAVPQTEVVVNPAPAAAVPAHGISTDYNPPSVSPAPPIHIEKLPVRAESPAPAAAVPARVIPTDYNPPAAPAHPAANPAPEIIVMDRPQPKRKTNRGRWTAGVVVGLLLLAVLWWWWAFGRAIMVETDVYVPAGSFYMGARSVDMQADADEKPQHWVSLDAYYIDLTEVTNAMYSECVSAGACQKPTQTRSATHASYYGNFLYADYPVIYVSWNDADAYCRWAGRRLPTEAEWEFAARGTDGRIYPWGSSDLTSSLLNFNNFKGDTTRVGSYPAGASLYGALDMAGNVWEWTADWYGPYDSDAVSNPTGPLTGDYRVLRGGSWYGGTGDVRSSDRFGNAPSLTGGNLGFRCSR